MKGISVPELLIAMALVATSLLGISAVLLYTQQQTAQNQQIQLALQLGKNIQQEMLLTQNNWDIKQKQDWEALVQFYLPEAHLILTADRLQIDWPSNKPATLHCHTKTSYSCLAIKN